MKKILLLLPLILFADVDPFTAGLNSNNPYGLTPQEKAILKNKKDIAKNSKEINSLKRAISKLQMNITTKFAEYDQNINEISDKLSAFNTIINELDATQATLNKLNKKVNDINLTDIYSRINKLNARIDNLEKEIDTIKDSIKNIVKIQNQNFQYLSDSIQDILQQLKKLNTKPLSVKEAFKKAKQLFFDGKLTESKKLFLYSLQNRYLPATSAFYLGEISYLQGDYKDALAFYKKSITLYPKKTSFTDKMLYHTAISFKKIGNKKAAKITFKKLIHDFPNSKYAKYAKKELEKL